MAESFVSKVVRDRSGNPYELARVAGRGSQGVVYEVAHSSFMVKLATTKDPAHREELQRRYEWLRNRTLHSGTRLVTPRYLLAPPHTGYVMDRVKGHEPLSHLFRPPNDRPLGEWYNKLTGGLRRRLLLGAQISRAFHYIQIDGLSYCDLSGSNILVAKDPAVLSIAIVDSDNLSVSGKAQSLVMGTPRFMAPEVLDGSHQPDALTDNYSLAVLLFHLLRLNHPLIGDAVEHAPPEQEEVALSGRLPYIDHSSDTSNRSSRVLPAEAVCTKQLSELFAQVFVDGLLTRSKRPTPGDWESACLQAVDATVTCANCKATFFPRSLDAQSGLCQCPWCGITRSIPPSLIFQDLALVEGQFIRGKPYSPIFLDAEITNITARNAYCGCYGEEGDRVVMRVRHDLERGSVIGQNKTDNPLHVRKPKEERWLPVKTEGFFPIAPGTQIRFGEAQDGCAVRLAILRLGQR